MQKGALFRRLPPQKAQKGEGFGGEARKHQRRHEGAGAGHEGIGNARLAQLLRQQIAGVGDDGRARVGDHGDLFPLPRQRYELFRRRALVELVAGDERLFDLIMIQKFEGVAGVFTEDGVDRPQYL